MSSAKTTVRATTRSVNVKASTNKAVVNKPAADTTKTAPKTTNTTKAVVNKPAANTTKVAPKTTNTTKAVVDKKNSDNQTTKKNTTKSAGLTLPVSRVRTSAVNKGVNVEAELALKELKEFKTLHEDTSEANYVKEVSSETQEIVEHAYDTVFRQLQDRAKTALEKLKKRNNPADAEKIANLTRRATKTNSLDEKLDLVSKLRYRFSGDATVSLTAVLDYTLQQLLKNGITVVCSEGKAIVNSSHVVGGDFTKLDVYPLVSTLGCVKAIVNKDVSEEDKKLPKKTLDFESASSQICKNMKDLLANGDESSPFAGVKVSKDLKVFCSLLVTELIQRFTPLVKLYADSINLRTVSVRAVKYIFDALLSDVTVTGGTVNSKALMSFVDARVNEYNSSRTK